MEVNRKHQFVASGLYEFGLMILSGQMKYSLVWWTRHHCLNVSYLTPTIKTAVPPFITSPHPPATSFHRPLLYLI